MHIGLDIGTSALKALLVDKRFVPIATASAPLSVKRLKDGYCEQDPKDWLAAVDSVMHSLHSEAPSEMADVISIGLSGQMHGMVALDSDKQVLRDAILWNDTRCGAQAQKLDSQNDDYRKIGGNAVMPGFTAPKSLWCAENEPALFAKIDKILLPKDYVRYWLSGEMISDMSDASGTLWLDIAKRKFSERLLAPCHLDMSAMPELVEGMQAGGSLRSDLAAQWGIKGTAIIAGAGDNAAAACGLGVVAPGDGFLSLGTSGVVFVVTERFAPAPDEGVHAFCHALPDTWHQMAVILSATDSLNWLAEIINQDVATLAKAAQSHTPSKQGCFFHPYLSGERTPHNDADARGNFIGLSRVDGMAEMAFAVLEGVAFALADCLDVLAKAGSQPDRLLVTGGGAKNHHWLQMIADVTAITIALPEDGDYGAALGAMRLGAIAAGCAPDKLLQKPQIAREFTCDRAAHNIYHERRKRWQAAYHDLGASRP